MVIQLIPLCLQLQAPFRGAQINEQQKEWNKAMSAVQTSVEWVFGDIVNYIKFLDFHKKLKIQLSAVGKMYIVCVILQNSRSCFYGSTTSNYCQPPLIQNYFR